MSRHPREDEYWNPEPLFPCETVFVIGGGTSLRGFDFSRLRDRVCVAINMAAYDVPWARAWYFMDNNVFADHRELVDHFAGHIVTSSRLAKRTLPDRIKRVRYEERPDFPPHGQSVIKHGRTSGHMGVSLSITGAAARVVLLGFDMMAETGASGGRKTHYHDRYKHVSNDSDLGEFAAKFAGWDAAARAAGAEILNATPGSALEEFRKVDLEDVLCGRC